MATHICSNMSLVMVSKLVNKLVLVNLFVHKIWELCSHITEGSSL